nr:uncharacterized protein LOC111426750 [Onthophagus taurus]
MKRAYLNLLYGCLSFCGFWPPDGSETIYAINMRVSIIVYTYHVFGVISYIVNIAPDSSVPGGEKLESLFVAAGLFQMLINCTAMFKQRHKIKQLYAILENFENYGIPENIATIAFIINMISVFFVCYCVTGGFFVALYPVYDYENCMWKAELSNKTILCGFGTKVSYPYDIQGGLVYLIHVAIEIYTICFSCSGGAIIVNCTLGAFEFIILRINQLKNMLDKAFETNDRLEHKKRFRECIIFHIYIIE